MIVICVTVVVPGWSCWRSDNPNFGSLYIALNKSVCGGRVMGVVDCGGGSIVGCGLVVTGCGGCCCGGCCCC